MLNINKISLLALLMMIFSTSAFPQKKEMEMANSEFDALQYNTAAEIYQKVLLKIKPENSPWKQEATFKLAECYRLMNNPDKAEPLYGELINSSYTDSNPVIYLHYASTLETTGNASVALEYYTKYLKMTPDNMQAKMGVRSSAWVIANQKNKAQVNVSDVHSLNSSDDDFSPAYYSKNFNAIVFTSNREASTGKNSDQWTGAKYSDLYESALTGSEWSSPVLFDKSGTINTDIHEGTSTFNGDFSVIYFTRCDRIGEKMEYCKIYKSQKTGNTWMKPELVFSDSTANVGQPSISKDEMTMVFSSEKDGGHGGKDLWMAGRESIEKEFGQPVNIPGINSSGDEMFPYLFNDTTLYFSSNGYEGYGGLDIYKSTRKGNNWSSPVNLLVPINSGYDDFGIIVRVPDEEGFFTSNRPGGLGGDDIFQFTRKSLLFSVSGKVKDNMTLLPMAGVQVLLIEDKKETLEIRSDAKGEYKFDTSAIIEDHDYELIFRKDNYFSKNELFTTKSYKDDHDFVFDIVLEPIPEKPIVLPDILYALDKWDLQPQYQDSLMQLVKLLLINQTLVIELRSHTDSRGSSEYNDVLSQKRAQSVVDFLVSQGVAPGRLVAKGYGKRVPRVLDRDIERENYIFKAGTELSDRFINALPSDEIKEAAFQLNRRTEFSVLSKDYKP